ncbi:hypothetical protein ES708_30722 [subsurface metagenome]
MARNFYNPDGYTIIYSCRNCNKGYIGKTKDNTEGFKESDEFLCIYCGTNSKKGREVYHSEVSTVIPNNYSMKMKRTSTKEEFSYWESIWFPSHNKD